MMGVRGLSGIHGSKGSIGRVSPFLHSHDFWFRYPYERLGHRLVHTLHTLNFGFRVWTSGVVKSMTDL